MYLKSFEELKNYVQGLDIKASEQLMILAAEKCADDVEGLRSFLNSKGIKFFGGIYAGLLVGEKHVSHGFIVQKYEPVYCSMVLPYMMRFKMDLKDIENCTAIVLVDGLSSKFKDLTDTVYDKLGGSVKYIGGGAGFYNLKHKPCIFDNNGLYEDALYICIIKSNINLAVRHGWRQLDGPFTVTKSDGGVLSRIDGYSAFDVYSDVIEENEGIRLLAEDFFACAKDHPFGIQKKGQSEFIVRDPILVNENNEIVCIADIPEGSDIYILKGNIDTLLASSLQIADYCAAHAPEKYKPLLFNCISRAMFMEDRFEEELKHIQDKLNYTVEGALSIGEISSLDNGELIIHNKSTILGVLETN